MNINININPFKAVNYKQSAIEKALANSGSLIVQTKYDGLRCHLCIVPAEDIQGKPSARLYALSRTNKVIPSLRELFSTEAYRVLLGQLLAESLYPAGLMIDGEVMVKGVDFNTGSGLLRRKTPIKASQLEYMIYGILSLEAIKADTKADIPVSTCVMQMQTEVLIHQVKELFPELSWHLAESHDVYHMSELEALYNAKREAGHEGLVIKDPMCRWKRGKKTGWFKMKPEDEADGVVVGINWGTEGLSNEGKVIGFQVLLESGSVVDANNASQFEMNQWTYHVEQHGEDSFNGRQAQVKYMEMTPSGSLRHPSFQRWRDMEGSEGIKS